MSRLVGAHHLGLSLLNASPAAVDRPKKVAKEIPELKKEAKAAASVKAESATPAPAAEGNKKLSKNQLKKLAAKEKAAASSAGEKTATVAPAAAAPAAAKKETAAPTPAPAAAKKAASKKQTLPSGLVLEDNKTGTGAAAKSGQRVQMRYIGRLSNGKIFDQNTKGAPFTFKLGKGEVIKGWDEGIAGMQVGGERRLVIPPGLAYGKQAISGIPPNSTLTFGTLQLSLSQEGIKLTQRPPMQRSSSCRSSKKIDPCPTRHFKSRPSAPDHLIATHRAIVTSVNRFCRFIWKLCQLMPNFFKLVKPVFSN